MTSPDTLLQAERSAALGRSSAPDTIFALSTAPGKSGVAVVRLSGPAAATALRTLAGRLPPPRRATLARLRDEVSRETLDHALTLWFPGPSSFTGEDVAEFHLHGGRATVAAVLDSLGRLPGTRPARAGEFSRRAFEGGRLDLAEAEALADLIDAETAAQRRLALGGLEGGLSARAADWRRRLIGLLALAEAAIDFADEEDVPQSAAPVAEGAAVLAGEIGAVLNDGARGERLRLGATIVLAGRPNVGKSTLLNCLASREAAIVSPHPGTTRDAVEVHLDLGGYPVTLVDTAGLRDSLDPVEIEGVRRARSRAAAADLVLWLEDGSAVTDGGHAVTNGAPVWRIRTKADLAPGDGREFAISCHSGAGIADLTRRLLDWLVQSFAGGPEPVITRARQREACTEAMAALQRAAAVDAPAEFVAEDLRLAARALGRLAGRIDSEDVLDQVFAAFCIGK